jgi:TonB family protein
MPFRQVAMLLITIFSPWLVLASASNPLPSSLKPHEQPRWVVATKRVTEFSSVPRTTVRTSCEASRPPEALTTPGPLLDRSSPNAQVKVSFIIGTDGRVYSPFILESAGPSEDRIVLNAVRSWRYRPATCNGMPAEAEARIGFSGR